MSISFRGAKKYKKHNGFDKSAEIHSPLPAPVYFFNLVQNTDVTLSPLVEVGDTVEIGSKIADLESYDAMPLYSSVSGIVTSVSDTFICVENNMKYTAVQTQKTDDIDSLTTREMLWIIREAGICEVRNGIPAHILLGTEKTPEYIIVPTFDSDPYVSSPQFASLGNTEKILKSLNIVMKILNTKKAIIAVENNTKKIFSDFKLNLRYNENISLCSLKARYPQSRDDILVKTLTGKDIDKINIVILSPETLCNIYDALTLQKPVTEKIITVSGDDILPPNNYKVPIGLPVSSLLHDSGYTSPETVIVGGIVDGRQITDLDEPITSSTNSIIAFNDSSNIPKYRKDLI